MERLKTIAGQTPIDDLSGLKVRVRTQSELNACEAENIRKALMRYLVGGARRGRSELDVRDVKRIHKAMFGDVWKWAGVVRTRELNMGSPRERIEIDLHNLLADLAAWKEYGMPLVEQATRLHHGAVRIHPFLNGNGRWSRMLANIWLRQHGHGLVEWPEAMIGTASVIRGEYLDALRAADRGEFAALVGLHERCLERVG